MNVLILEESVLYVALLSRQSYTLYIVHLIIYGHNMRVKSMFGSLHDFESEDFYKKHNKIYYDRR